MNDGTRIAAVKLTATERQAVEQLVEMGYFKTVSALLRTGLMLVLEQHHVKLETLADIRIERVRHPMRRRKKGEADASDEG